MRTEGGRAADPEFDIRPYQAGDEAQIRELFQLSFGRPLPEARRRWRYQDNPAGPALIDLAWRGEVLVAHRAQSLFALCVEGQERLAGLGGGIMTRPEYRGRGLYAALTNRQLQRLAQQGAAIAIGLPNSYSHRIIVRDIGYVDIHEVPTFCLRLGAERAFPAVRRVVELSQFDARFDRLWQRVKDDHPIIARRDRAHLQWRYVQNPTVQYRILACEDNEELLGYAVCKRFGEQVHVVDLLSVKEAEIGLHLISRAIEIARRDGASALSMWLNVNHPLHWELEKRGFRNQEPVTYFTGLVLRREFSAHLVYDYRSWYLTMGDSDVY
ncbi:MAG: GNAT family N-acetyltransferase [Anaerolineales bacterium]|nr:MAG: GNAT family N-acetyltransferase [Anaerolineales bacterium]